MSRLEEISLQYRTCTIAKNDYNINNKYVVGHEDALSTGDEQGKGEANGSIGSATDIKTRNKLLSKGKSSYSSGREYNAGTVGGSTS